MRKLLPPSIVPTLCTAIDEVTEACSRTAAAARDQEHTCFYDPPEILREVMQGAELGRSRSFHRDSGSAMCAEAPSVAETLLALYGSL